jgi:hypothetical protein
MLYGWFLEYLLLLEACEGSANLDGLNMLRNHVNSYHQ